MNITVDANVLFSALLKDSGTRHLWFNPEFTLFAPAYLRIEFTKYEGELRRKFTGTDKEFIEWAAKFFAQIRFIQDEELAPFLPAAASLIHDPKDWLYLACALKENTIIWSQDKGFKEQKRISIKTTNELMEEFGGL